MLAFSSIRLLAAGLCSLTAPLQPLDSLFGFSCCSTGPTIFLQVPLRCFRFAAASSLTVAAAVGGGRWGDTTWRPHCLGGFELQRATFAQHVPCLLHFGLSSVELSSTRNANLLTSSIQSSTGSSSRAGSLDLIHQRARTDPHLVIYCLSHSIWSSSPPRGQEDQTGRGLVNCHLVLHRLLRYVPRLHMPLAD